VRSEGWRRERLRALVRRFRESAQAFGVALLESATPIQPVLLGSPAAALSAQHALAAAGYWVVAIRPPTVPAGSARLRVTLSAAHAEAQVEALAQELGRACAGARNA
jgi:8-amino-7-oxononanoate synthase